MEQTGVKNQKLGAIFAILIASLALVYFVSLFLPFLTYTQTAPEVAGQEETISMMEYLWLPHHHADLINKILPEMSKAELGVRYNITASIAFPLAGFAGALVSAALIYFARKRAYTVLVPMAWSLACLVGYLVAPVFKLACIASSTLVIHMILLAIIFVLSVISFIRYSIPRIHQVRAERALL